MDKYIFLITEKGARTNICSNIKLLSLSGLIKWIESEDFRWYINIRVGKLDDERFQTRILKYISLKEFEDIFCGHIEKIKPLLEYKTYGDKYFRNEVLKKYGIKKEN